MEILAAVIIYIAGIVTGVYAASQMEKDINKRIKK
tara:strand:+ start:546 stop:650 length:105 start_codon:yes stop_codon:yes gene_type:complete